jgi:hypothetical protein
MSKQTRLSLLVLLIVFILFGIAGQMDYEDAVEQENYYCEMVKIWEDDAARGVRAEDRAGWPPFKGENVSCPSQ